MNRVLSSLLIVTLLGISGASAEARSLSEQRFNVTIRNQDVREVLGELSVALGVPIKMTDAVEGRVSASFDDATASDLLDLLSRERGLDWRFDGRRIEVSAKSEQVTRIMSLDGVMTQDLTGALKALGVYEERFPLTAVDGEFGLIVAPPAYIALVEVVLAELIDRRKEMQASAEEEAKRRLEDERLELARQLEEQRLEAERLRAFEQQNTVRQGPVIVRNGVWGG